MNRRPPRSTRTDTLFPYTTLFRSLRQRGQKLIALGIGQLRHPSLPSSAPRMGCSPFSPHRRRLAPPPHSSAAGDIRQAHRPAAARSEEHTSELQSLMRISYAVFCLKKKKQTKL